MTRTISSDGLAVLKYFEACKLVAYQDSAKIWTIGWGHIKNVRQGMTCTQAQADAWLTEDVAEKVDDLNTMLVRVEHTLTQHQYDALGVMAFNIGIYALSSSTLWRLFKSRGPAAVTKDMFTRWNKVKDPKTKLLVPSRGLTRRRTAEFLLYAEPDSVSITIHTIHDWDVSGRLEG
jgi:lysozyme